MDVRFRILAGRAVGFTVSDYDDAFPLVIDPLMSWNTFMGSNGADWGRGSALGAGSYVYVAGYRDTSWGGPVTTFAGTTDAFAVRISQAQLAKKKYLACAFNDN